VSGAEDIAHGAADTAPGVLPERIPIFPLPRVVLLPRVDLPLNIFEPRYLAMIDYAMAHGRLIGMIQHRPDAADGSLFTTGCVGRIAAFDETEDGRYLIKLRGVCRFDIAAEEPLHAGGFRMVRANFEKYAHDLVDPPENDICREAMLNTLRVYLGKMNMLCDKWEHMRNISCDRLVSTLAVICPFSAAEKQMLLEAPNLKERMKVLSAFLEAATGEKAEKECGSCH
jgi:Lon protease-like protein